MTLILSGTNGLSDVDGDASTPAIRGTDANTGMFFGSDIVGLSTGGTEKVSVGASALVINDGGANYDFRVEGDTNANLLFVDASADSVGMGSAEIAGFYGSSLVDTKALIAYDSSSTSPDTAPKGLVIRNDNTAASNLSQLVFATKNNNGSPVAVSSIYSINDARGVGFNTGSLGFGTVGGSGIIAERMRIDSGGNVGIGSTNPAYKLDVVAANRAAGANYSSSDMLPSTIAVIGGVENDLSKAATLTLNQFNSAGSIAVGYTSTFAGFMAFGTSNGSAQSPVERMRLTSDGYLRMASGTGGIQFNGDTAAANALDDYEEGTWTPTITGSSSAPTGISYTSQNGAYTKIGRLVNVSWYIEGTITGKGTGDVQVGGLPFTSISGSVFPSNKGATGYLPTTTYIYSLNGSTLLGFGIAGTGTLLGCGWSDANVSGTNFQIHMQITYFTT
jgi:hypothetical protein